MPEDSHNEIIQAWDIPFPVGNDENITKLLRVIGTENRRLDLDIESLYDNRFIRTATGSELGKLGAEVGIQRNQNETDDVFRKRIIAEYGAQSSDTTFDEFGIIALGILDASVSDISITTPPESGTKTVEIEVDGDVLDQNPLTVDQLNDLLDKSIGAGANVRLVEIGTFAFAGDDDSLKGFNEGTWSSSR